MTQNFGYDDESDYDEKAQIWALRLLITMDAHDKADVDKALAGIDALTATIEKMSANQDRLWETLKTLADPKQMVTIGQHQTSISVPTGVNPQEVARLVQERIREAAEAAGTDVEFVDARSMGSRPVNIPSVWHEQPSTPIPSGTPMPDAVRKTAPNLFSFDLDALNNLPKVSDTDERNDTDHWDDAPVMEKPEPPAAFAEYPADTNLTTAPLKGSILQVDKNMVLTDYKGVLTARYLLPYNHTLIWLRDDDATGDEPEFILKVADEKGRITVYQPIPRAPKVTT